MAQGLMATDTYYPSSNGIPLAGASMLDGFNMVPHDISLSVSKTPGSSATYALEVLMKDTNISTWVPVKNGSITGSGATATGNIIVRNVIGLAVRLNAANGGSPGTSTNTPQYALNAYPSNSESAFSPSQSA